MRGFGKRLAFVRETTARNVSRSKKKKESTGKEKANS